MSWICNICGKEFDNLPMYFGAEAPWHLMVGEAEFSSRVELTNDQCVVDGKHFFVRGHIEIPVLDAKESFIFSVWSSLSEQSFHHMDTRWDNSERVNDPPYFGWLCSSISIYPDTIGLKTSVQSRAVGIVPLLTLELTAHPLTVEHHQGINMDRVFQIAHKLLHSH